MRVSIFPLLLLATTVAAQTPTLEQSYKSNWAPRLVPLLTEAIRFPTVAGDAKAFADNLHGLTIKAANEPGILMDVTFDQNGDIDRQGFLVEIVDGKQLIKQVLPKLN